jgi:S-formylglutathione hydrolase FrmB
MANQGIIMRKNPANALIFLMIFPFLSMGGTVVIDSIRSDTIGKTLNYMAILPNGYEARVQAGERFPVLYLLHCLGNDYYSWTQFSYGARVDEIIDSVGFIVAAPSDGNSASWWLDSPKKSDSRFSAFLVREFKPHIDARFATLPDRKNTGISGHSMGGFGAFHNLIEHPGVFGSAFSIKGGFDPSLPLNPNWPGDFHMGDLLGTGGADTANWDRVNVLKNIHRLRGQNAAIAFYSGTSDTWFHQENVRLHAILDSLAIPHGFDTANDMHASLPFEQMKKVMKYFDSVFVKNPAGIRPGRNRYRAEKFLPQPGESGAIRYVTISGRSVDYAHAAGQVIVMVQGKGCRASVRRLFHATDP